MNGFRILIIGLDLGYPLEPLKKAQEGPPSIRNSEKFCSSRSLMRLLHSESLGHCLKMSRSQWNALLEPHSSFFLQIEGLSIKEVSKAAFIFSLMWMRV